MRRKQHKDVDFAVDDASGRERIFKAFDEACGFAVGLAASDGRSHDVDVLIHSEAGAKWWGGDDAVESYRDDPEASVSERITVQANAVGRVA